MRCWLHTTLTPTPILNPTVTLIYTPTPPATQHYPILPPQLSSTVNPTLTRTLTLNFMPTTPQPAQPHLQPIPPALVLCQSCLDPSHNPKLLPNPTSNPNSFGESGFGETGFGEPEGHPLVVVSIGQYKWFSVSIPVRYSHFNNGKSQSATPAWRHAACSRVPKWRVRVQVRVTNWRVRVRVTKKRDSSRTRVRVPSPSTTTLLLS